MAGKKGKAGRPVGSTNKNTRMLMLELKNNYDFSIVEEILELYGYSKQIYLPLFKKVQINLAQDLPPTAGFVDTEVTAMNEAGKSMGDILGKLMAYCYPKLKAIELGQGGGDKIQFNITIPKIDNPKKALKNITPKR